MTQVAGDLQAAKVQSCEAPAHRTVMRITQEENNHLSSQDNKVTRMLLMKSSSVKSSQEKF